MFHSIAEAGATRNRKKLPTGEVLKVKTQPLGFRP